MTIKSENPENPYNRIFQVFDFPLTMSFSSTSYQLPLHGEIGGRSNLQINELSD